MNVRFGAFLVLILFTTVAVPATGREVSKDYRKTFDAREGVCLHLKHGDGNVTIKPWDRDIVDVEVHYRAEVKALGLGGDHEFDVEFRQSEDAIHVIGRERISGVIGFLHYFRRYEYTYNIRAPAYLELNLRGDDGDVDIEKWRGKIVCTLDDGEINLRRISSPVTRLRIEDGNLQVDDLEGKLSVIGEDGDVTLTECKTPLCRVSMEDGDVTMKRCEGDFEIDLEDGNIEIQRMHARSLDIRTEDGDIDLDLLKTEEIDLDIITDDGNIRVDLERGISAVFSIDADDGRITVDLPDATQLKKGRRWVKGELHGGKGRIRIRGADGRIIIRESR